MKKAVIFDMDGLMVDSIPSWIDAISQLVKPYGKQFSHEIRKKYTGMRVTGMMQIIIREYGLPISVEEGERVIKARMKINFRKPTLTLLPGCETLVKSLSKSGTYSLAVASSSPRDFIEVVVNKFHLENDYGAIVSGEEVTNGKPAPDIFLKAAKLLGVEPHYSLVLEDSPHGIDAAKAGGMKAIAVNNSPYYRKEDYPKADLFVHSLEEIDERVIEDVFS